MTPVPTHLPAAARLPAPLAPAKAFLDPNPARRVVVEQVVIDLERPGDAEARESLLDRAFGPGRFAKTCERLRARRLPAHGLSLVARVHEHRTEECVSGLRDNLMRQENMRHRHDAAGLGGGAEVGRDSADRDIVGTVRLWHVAAGEHAGAPVPALMLGPLAVEDAWRCHRLGARLMEEAIGRARALGHGAILLVGDAPYYRRFGFSRVEGLSLPGPVDPARVLALELVPGALAGARGTVRATGALDLAGHRSRRGRRSRRGPGRRAA